VALPGNWNVQSLVQDDIEALDNSIVIAEQVHCGEIVTASDIVIGKTKADGIFIDKQDIKAAVLTADCMPLVLTTNDSALVLHVSRKSLINGLLDKVDHFIEPENITGIYIGPHICAEHFTFPEAGEEIKKFQKMFPKAVAVKENIYHLSLRRAVNTYFKKWGIGDALIKEDGRCTFKEESLPSYKRWLGSTAPLGRIVTVVSR
jgi:copper oxidase (laccase) domain-containing protein